MNKEEYIDKLYEECNENFERSSEYQEAAEKLEAKFSEMKSKFTEEQLKDINEFEQCLVNLLEIEIKMSFKAGFKSAVSIEREMKK